MENKTYDEAWAIVKKTPDWNVYEKALVPFDETIEVWEKVWEVYNAGIS